MSNMRLVIICVVLSPQKNKILVVNTSDARGSKTLFYNFLLLCDDSVVIVLAVVVLLVVLSCNVLLHSKLARENR